MNEREKSLEKKLEEVKKWYLYHSKEQIVNKQEWIELREILSK